MFKSRPRSVLGAPRRSSIPSLMAQSSTCSHRGQCPRRSPRAESPRATGEAEIPKTHLRPLRHLPLGPAGWVFADLALVRPGDVGRLAEVAVDGAVEARGDHLPAAHDAELVALAARAGALAPAARLPPAGRERGVVQGKPHRLSPHHPHQHHFAQKREKTTPRHLHAASQPQSQYVPQGIWCPSPTHHVSLFAHAQPCGFVFFFSLTS